MQGAFRNPFWALNLFPVGFLQRLDDCFSRFLAVDPVYLVDQAGFESPGAKSVTVDNLTEAVRANSRRDILEGDAPCVPQVVATVLGRQEEMCVAGPSHIDKFVRQCVK